MNVWTLVLLLKPFPKVPAALLAFWLQNINVLVVWPTLNDTLVWPVISYGASIWGAKSYYAISVYLFSGISYLYCLSPYRYTGVWHITSTYDDLRTLSQVTRLWDKGGRPFKSHLVRNGLEPKALRHQVIGIQSLKHGEATAAAPEHDVWSAGLSKHNYFFLSSCSLYHDVKISLSFPIL